MLKVLHIQNHVGSYCQLFATWVGFDYSYNSWWANVPQNYLNVEVERLALTF